MVQITLATRADLPRILEISNRAAEDGTANFATQPETLADWQRTYDQTCEQYPWLVARDGPVIVGWAKGGPHRARGAYAWTAEVSIYLAPEHHRKGVGAQLYGVLLPLLKAQGFVTLLAGITGGHVASERLHAKVGFVRCATYHRVGWKFGAWHDVGYHELHLRGDGPPPSRLLTVAEAWKG